MVFFRPSRKQNPNEEADDGGSPAGCLWRQRNYKKAQRDYKFEKISKKLDRKKKDRFVGGMINDLEELKRVPDMNYIKLKYL